MNVIIIQKNGNIENKIMKDFNKMYSLCKYRNNNSFVKLHTWLCEDYVLELYGKEKDKEVSQCLKYINKLEISVAHPFLMKVYEDYGKSIINKQTFINILNFIQSFVWRRFIVGLQTNALNKIFMNLYEHVDYKNYLF